MKKTKLALALALMFCIPAYAAEYGAFKSPNKVDAEKWLNDFTDAQDMTRDVAVLESNLKKEELTVLLKGLREKAEDLFGDVVSPYGDCTKTAESVNWYWQTQTSLLTDPTNDTERKAAGLVTLAWEAGEYYSKCTRLIDTLK